MRIGLMSHVAGRPDAGLEDLVLEARDAEARGFAFLSVPHIFGLDAIGALTVAGRETRRISGASPGPEPPGLSHVAPVVRLVHPRLQVSSQVVGPGLQVAGAKPVPGVVAALGPLMLGIAGRLADGTATWMTGPRTLAEHTVPTIGAAAKEAGRPEPRVIAALPIAVTSDPSGAREVGSRLFQVYGTLPSYRAMLDREGAVNPGDVAIVGDESEVRAGLRRLAEAGVTDFAASCYRADAGAVERTLDFLASEL
jgi:alkanesulfonate monooxygenase SsuD/methylene tetrahydromethanopterin reductase-like flavin-dependent oxidoreductase (luciferase family)